MHSPDINGILARLRAYRRAAHISLSGFALKAGLSRSALAGMDRDEWSPTADTIRALEALIPEGWREGEPVAGGEAEESTPAERRVA